MEHLPAVRRQVPIQAEPGFKGSLYNNWTHAYSLQALALLLKRHAGDKERCDKIRHLMAQQVDMLRRYECVDGGWCYYDLDIQTELPAGSTMSFMTAAVLVALRAAKDSGVEVPQRIVDRAMASIRRQRKADFSVIYGEYLKNQPMRLVNRPMGSLGRSQACNVAMRLWGDPKVTDQVIKVWLDWLIARNFWLDAGRKTVIPHESWCQVAGYFYLFRPLLCGAVHRAVARGRAAPLPRPTGPRALAGAGQGRLVVGLPALRLPSAIRHGLCADVAGALPAAVGFVCHWLCQCSPGVAAIASLSPMPEAREASVAYRNPSCSRAARNRRQRHRRA